MTLAEQRELLGTLAQEILDAEEKEPMLVEEVLYKCKDKYGELYLPYKAEAEELLKKYAQLQERVIKLGLGMRNRSKYLY